MFLLLVSIFPIGLGHDVNLLGERKIEIDDSFDYVKNLQNSSWPMQGYNRKHIGRSPYSTANNPGIEKWRFTAGDWCDGSPIIGADGTIYFGSFDQYLYAINPDGSLKWKFKADRGLGSYGSHPAIADDGTIYIASRFGSRIQAVNANGTGKWSYGVPEVHTSITIGVDDVIYYGHELGLDARHPNGTLKWTYSSEGSVYSTPAIDDNGIIYFGSHDFNIYALNPNGTLKWNYTTNAWVHGSPAIGTDGSIYCGSDDDYLYAFNPDGTLQWKTDVGSGMYSSPSQDKNGNLYFGVWHSKIVSVAPNGIIRWEFSLPDRDRVWGSTAAISDDGTVYIGNCIDMDMNGGGEIIALDLNGNLKWRKIICDSSLHSSPVIGDDGTVYICASNDGSPEAWGYLHAFGTVEDNQPPETPTIDGPTEGEVRTDLKYVVKAEDFDKTPVSYYFDWGDGTDRQTVDYEPGISIPVYHMWTQQGPYTIKVKAIDTFGLESDWATLEVTIPKNKETPSFLEQFMDSFPLLERLLFLFNLI